MGTGDTRIYVIQGGTIRFEVRGKQGKNGYSSRQRPQHAGGTRTIHTKFTVDTTYEDTNMLIDAYCINDPHFYFFQRTAGTGNEEA